MDGSGFTHEEKTRSCSTSDIISNLPCNVLENILVCLTLQDAAKTSVLSRKWRYVWTTLPQLVFDDKFCRGWATGATTDKLMMIMYKVLLLRHGPILKFTLSLVKLKSCPEIDQLIFSVSKNCIREFTLHIWNGEPYKLPSTLFSCLQLECLNLHSCVFKPPPGFKGFTRLLSLDLYKVVIAGDVLSSLTSSCLLLERLTLKSCSSFDYLEIEAPSLKCFLCEGLFRSIFLRIPSECRDFTLVWEGSRKQLGFNGGETCNSAMLRCTLPDVQFLVLDYQYLKCMAASGVQERLPTTLKCLIYLNLHDVSFGEPDEVSTVVYLIRSSPNLQELDIRAFHGATAAIVPLVELFNLRWSDVTFTKLWHVNMEELSGTKAEMEFLKLLLAKSPMLETMAIKMKSKEVAEELRIVKELIGFRRASTNAVIIFPK